MWTLWRYAGTPGESAQPPDAWPQDSQIKLRDRGSTLVMFAHSQCPCTRASLAELQRVLAKSDGPVTPWIVFYEPSDALGEHRRTDLWQAAQSIPGAQLASDPGGREAKRFHVLTSGQTLLYDSTGKLQFSGGITSARGHEGDNPGQAAITDLLNHGSPACRETPVFGCPIAHRSDEPPTELERAP